ncbi:MAG: hypothetical protein ACOYUZ_04030 [Patescibacteria group bacterium]
MPSKKIEAQEPKIENQDHKPAVDLKLFFFGAGAAAILLIGAFGFFKAITPASEAQEDKTDVADEAVYEGEYQAVFLSNGQVYFGMITEKTEEELVLKNIYYLQTDRASANGIIEGQGDLKIIKLGNELHGPEDRMYINREHILFVEDLKEDSKVVKAIKSYLLAK